MCRRMSERREGKRAPLSDKAPGSSSIPFVLLVRVELSGRPMRNKTSSTRWEVSACENNVLSALSARRGVGVSHPFLAERSDDLTSDGHIDFTTIF
jgi:hypothetical protein